MILQPFSVQTDAQRSLFCVHLVGVTQYHPLLIVERRLCGKHGWHLKRSLLHFAS